LPTHALTIKHPWLWCILHSDKRIENRSWAPPARHVGTRVYLHSAKQFDHDGVAFCEQNGVELPDDYHFGCIEGSAGHSDDPWYQGPVGWSTSNAGARTSTQIASTRCCQVHWIHLPETPAVT